MPATQALFGCETVNCRCSTFGISTDGLLIALLLITGPVVSHAIASAAYRLGLPMRDPIVDELGSLEQKPAGAVESRTV